MSLEDVMATDIGRVFFRAGDGAQTHRWNDATITTLTDRQEHLKRQPAFENPAEELLIHSPASCFEKRPVINESIFFDNRKMTIIDVGENDGVYDILLRREKGRGT